MVLEREVVASQLQNRDKGKDKKKKNLILQECLGDGSPRRGDVCWDAQCRVLGEVSELMGTQ